MSKLENSLFELMCASMPGFPWSWFEELASPKAELFEQARAEEGNSEAARQLLARFIDPRTRSQLEGIFSRCAEQGVYIISWSSSEYPHVLRSIYQPPLVLFARARNEDVLSILAGPSASIVGSRKADQSGMDIARTLGRETAHAGIQVVSGLALGIDSAAHQGALEVRRSEHAGRTIAVLGHGLDFLYPSSNTALAEKIIAEGGVLLSQYLPNTPPLPAYFLDRNRVIAGLSRVVAVVQATARSGSLATARFGLEGGREVLVAPGAIDDPRYEGSNQLLKQGAGILVAADDILEHYPERIVANAPTSSAKAAQHLVVSFLRDQGPLAIDEVRMHFSDRSGLEQELLELELAGELTRLPGNLLSAAPQR